MFAFPSPGLPIHNLNTEENFSTIQAAIDDPDTKSPTSIPGFEFLFAIIGILAASNIFNQAKRVK
jgi:hypothetical protein